MRIRRLKLSGFKSFVEPAELRVEPGLTGVVGPNGCGKSNLLEAIRWVMGEGSPKSLRGGGMDDVIFAGTERRPARDFAEVSMLVEQDGEADGPQEMEVSRRIERGAGSAYRLNGRDVRQKDVALLFADSATGAHSPALVSQGRIGAVIAARPQERRQMLEEAAGIAGLHARRKDAEARLRATEANLGKLDEILAEGEARAAALRRQARVAERYRELSKRIRLAEARLTLSHWSEADRLARAAGGEAEAAQDRVEMLTAEAEQAQAEQAGATERLAERRAASATALAAAQALAHRLASEQARLDTAERRLDELARMIAQASDERAREQALRTDAQAAEAALEAEGEAIALRLAAAEGDSVRLATALSAAEAQAREAEAALSQLLGREAAMAAEQRVAEAALTAARHQAARLEEEDRRLAQQAAGLGLGADETLAREEARRQRRLALADAAKAERALQAAEAERACAAEARDRAEPALAAARAELAGAQSEAKALRAALDGGGSPGSGVRAAPGYERALAAALGSDLDAPVGSSGERYWGGSETQPDDPPLPAGLDSLAAHVEAPPELARRLSQVAVADQDSGVPLPPGQRLVTLAGALRRWDGFVATQGDRAAAERLLRGNRLAQIEAGEAARAKAVTEAEAERDRALANVDRALVETQAAREMLSAAERSAREAARAEDVAGAAMERAASQAAALALRRAELMPVRKAALAEARAAEAALTALPGVGGLVSEIAAAREQAAARGVAVAERRAEAATQMRALAADRERQAVALRDRRAWRDRAEAADVRLGATAARGDALAAEQSQLAGEPEALAEAISSSQRALGEAEAQAAAARLAEGEAEADLAAATAALRVGGEALADAREVRAGAEARAQAQAARRDEHERACRHAFDCAPPQLADRFALEPATVSDPSVEADAVKRLTAERERIGAVNLVAADELAQLESRAAVSAAERDELQQAVHQLRGSIGHLNREGRVRLLDAFAEVDRHFQSLFTTLFDGGQAQLQLIESDDPLEAGLEILAQPPGKRLAALTLLSGGEQALTAVALIFAFFLTNPAPICVLDEVDAPLDDANVDRFCTLLERMRGQTDTRYLIVTHNAVTMSRMDRLYGVTMVEQGVSRLVSVDLGTAETLLAAE